MAYRASFSLAELGVGRRGRGSVESCSSDLVQLKCQIRRSPTWFKTSTRYLHQIQ